MLLIQLLNWNMEAAKRRGNVLKCLRSIGGVTCIKCEGKLGLYDSWVIEHSRECYGGFGMGKDFKNNIS